MTLPAWHRELNPPPKMEKVELRLFGKSLVWLFGETLGSFTHDHVLLDATSCCQHG